MMKAEEILNAVLLQEWRFSGSGMGAVKREACVDWLMGRIKFPWWVPVPIRRVLLGYLVDLTVYVLNWAWGKVWPKIKILEGLQGKL